MTDTDAQRQTTTARPEGDRPPIIDRHLPPAEPKRDGPLDSIEGADRAGLGLTPEPASAPPGAHVDGSRTQVPGPRFGDTPADAEKPWETSLATKNDHTGIGAEPDAEGEL